MKGFNRVFLVGYVGGTPEIQKSRTGSPYTRLSVATHHSRKLEDGTWNTATEWHKVMVWGKKAELCAERLIKGAALAVEGHLESYQLERAGEAFTQTSIVAEEVHFLPIPKQKEMTFDPIMTVTA